MIIRANNSFIQLCTPGDEPVRPEPCRSLCILKHYCNYSGDSIFFVYVVTTGEGMLLFATFPFKRLAESCALYRHASQLACTATNM
jgi:hypothetical protein